MLFTSLEFFFFLPLVLAAFRIWWITCWRSTRPDVS